ncbi:MAG: 2,3-bisphosphoglycerate-independent phosphoglycerate mutase [Candidatus Kerfeldbacteria bacterium]
MRIPNKPVMLIILDGWGIAPKAPSNPIGTAETPNIDSLIDNYPTLAVQASGEAVGLPWGEMGNSEVGHLNLGAGRIMYQNLPRISKSIAEKSFYKKEAFLHAAKHVKKNKSAIHLMGLVGVGSIHASVDHLYGLMEFCAQQKISKVYLHLFLDGRDSPKDSAAAVVGKIIDKIEEIKVGEIASLTGRFFAMDRDNRWKREEKTYNSIVNGDAEYYDEDPISAIKASYKRKVYDEEFEPTIIGTKEKPVGLVQDKDAVIFFNFRPDRARQLTSAFTLPGFDKFDRPEYMKNLFFATMTQYDKDLPVEIAFLPENIEYPIARVISESKLKQLHISETEKYAHVTYFFNGGQEKPFTGQENVIIPSPAVPSYDKQPEMSASKLTDRLIKEIKSEKFDFIVANYANADMVGHTGNIKATIKGIEAVDECIGRVTKEVLEKDGLVFITADHGNAEEMTNMQTGAMDKEHSVNPVPVIAVGNKWKGNTPFKDIIVDHDLSMLQPTGILSDIPVTILIHMGLKPAVGMTGNDLLDF